MEPLHGLGFAGFLAQADVVGRCVLAMLLAMSLVSWYLIVTKAIQLVSVRRRSARFLRAFWDSPSLQSVVGHLEKSPAEGPFAQLAERALAAGIDSVAFDRAGYRYHGRIKALAEAAREAGLKF